MKVSGFMVPADKIMTVNPNTPVQEAMDRLVERNVGSIVVIETVGPNEPCRPVGLITKSDIARAYQAHVPLHAPCQRIMYKGPLHTCTQHMGRDKAARIMEEEHIHHLIVVDDKDSSLLGLISSWDIAAECARDDKAWPWARFAKEEGRTTVDVSIHGYPTIVHHKHDKLTYEDGLDIMQFQ